MAKASISRAWEESKLVLARNFALFSTVALALMIFPMTILGTIAPTALMGVPATEPLAAAFALIAMLIGLLARITIVRMAQSSAEAVSGAIGIAAKRFLPAFGAFLLFIVPLMLLAAPLIPLIVASPQAPPPEAALGLLLIMVLGLIFGTRLLSMVIPAAAVESLGPIALLKRSWSLTRGNWLRLFGFILLFYLASAVASRAVSFVLGAVLALAAGPIESMTVSALLFASVLSTVSAMFVVVFMVMLARIYAQLAGASAKRATVPKTAD